MQAKQKIIHIIITLESLLNSAYCEKIKKIFSSLDLQCTPPRPNNTVNRNTTGIISPSCIKIALDADRMPCYVTSHLADLNEGEYLKMIAKAISTHIHILYS